MTLHTNIMADAKLTPQEKAKKIFPHIATLRTGLPAGASETMQYILQLSSSLILRNKLNEMMTKLIVMGILEGEVAICIGASQAEGDSITAWLDIKKSQHPFSFAQRIAESFCLAYLKQKLPPEAEPGFRKKERAGYVVIIPEIEKYDLALVSHYLERSWKHKSSIDGEVKGCVIKQIGKKPSSYLDKFVSLMQHDISREESAKLKQQADQKYAAKKAALDAKTEKKGTRWFQSVETPHEKNGFYVKSAHLSHQELTKSAHALLIGLLVQQRIPFEYYTGPADNLFIGIEPGKGADLTTYRSPEVALLEENAEHSEALLIKKDPLVCTYMTSYCMAVDAAFQKNPYAKKCGVNVLRESKDDMRFIVELFFEPSAFEKIRKRPEIEKMAKQGDIYLANNSIYTGFLRLENIYIKATPSPVGDALTEIMQREVQKRVDAAIANGKPIWEQIIRECELAGCPRTDIQAEECIMRNVEPYFAADPHFAAQTTAKIKNVAKQFHADESIKEPLEELESMREVSAGVLKSRSLWVDNDINRKWKTVTAGIESSSPLYSSLDHRMTLFSLKGSEATSYIADIPGHAACREKSDSSLLSSLLVSRLRVNGFLVTQDHPSSLPVAGTDDTIETDTGPGRASQRYIA